MSDPAGRSLDAAVAERCFGHKVSEDERIGPTIPAFVDWIQPLPDYSTDWSAAGEVWEWLRLRVDGTMDGSMELVRKWDKVECNWVRGGDYFDVIGDSVPHALCLAALAVAESLKKKESP